MMEIVIVSAAAIGVFELVSGLKLMRFLRMVAVNAFAAAEQASMRLIRMIAPPQFTRLGTCYRCGECCRMIIGNPPKWIKKSFLLKWFVLYHRHAHNFEVSGRGEEGELIFCCGYLREDGRCGIYRHRPLLCRNYPVMPFFDMPGILPICSYRTAPTVVARMRKRTTLPIINPGVTVHHETRENRGAISQEEDFVWIDDT